MVIYDNNLTDYYSEKVKKAALVCFLPTGIAILVCVVLCFLKKEDNDNANILKIFNIIITTASGWFSISVFFLHLLPVSRRKKLLKTIFSSPKKEFCGEVLATDGSFTLQEGVKVAEIRMNCDKKEHVFYFDLQMGKPQFKKGDILKITVARNFIFEYRVIDHEEEK